MVRSLVLWVAAAAAVGRALGKGCAVFDSDMNLLVLAPSADYSLGPQSDWSSASAQALTSSGSRPPFDGDRPRCHLAQPFNAVYALGVDSAHPGAIWVFDAAAKSWTMQDVSTSGDVPDPTTMLEILDHDTNVLYAYSKQTTYFVHFDDQKAATSSAKTWENQGSTFPFPTDSYQPTIANANNRIHIFGAPGSQAGQNYLFVIHFAYPQPEAQLYPTTNGGANFPVSHGWAGSIYSATNTEQRQVFFIPDDMSATYLVDSKTNQTLPMAAPSNKHDGAYFAGSTSAVVQLAADGKVSYLPIDQADISGSAANRAAVWTDITTVNLGTSTPGNTSSGTTSSTPSGANPTKPPSSPSGTGTGSGSKPTTTPDAAGHFASVSSLLAVGAAAFVAYAL